MRFFSFVLLVSVPVCIVMTGRKLGFRSRGIFFSILMYLSCPLSWFTGKIIGPEIMGWAIGVWGGYCAISSMEDGHNIKVSGLFGAGVIMGISAGIKLNYAVFFVFAVLYFLFTRAEFPICRRTEAASGLFPLIKTVFLMGIAFIAGIILADPIIMTDFEVFRSMYGGVGGYSVSYLKNVLWRNYIEWNLVNSGGMNHTIISVAAFIMVLFLSYSFRKDKALITAAILSTAVLLAICCKARFLGWYLLPLIYFVCLIIPDTKLTAVVLAVNLLFMFPDISYQITSKMQQIQMLRELDAVEDITNLWECDYPDYKVYYFIEVCLDDHPMFASYDYANEKSSRRLIFISERAKANELIKSLYDQGTQNKNGYRLAEERNDIAVIIYEDDA